MKRKKTMEDRMLEEMGVEIVDGSQVGRAGSIPVVGTLSKHTTPADFRRFERIAGLRRDNKDN